MIERMPTRAPEAKIDGLSFCPIIGTTLRMRIVPLIAAILFFGVAALKIFVGWRKRIPL
jgi:hypothetical protein